MHRKGIAMTVLVATMAFGWLSRGQAQPAQAVVGKSERLQLEDISEEDLLDALALLEAAQGRRLEGSWDITVSPAGPPGAPPPPSFQARATLAAGGGLFGTDRRRPFSKQQGSWAHLGGNEFAWTFLEDLFDPSGNFVGTATVRARVALVGRDQLVGVSNATARDAQGNVLFEGCGTVEAFRIQIEPIAPQCEVLSPR